MTVPHTSLLDDVASISLTHHRTYSIELADSSALCHIGEIVPMLLTEVMCSSDASISLFQFRYDIDTIFAKYRDIDIDIDIKYVCFLQT